MLRTYNPATDPDWRIADGYTDPDLVFGPEAWCGTEGCTLDNLCQHCTQDPDGFESDGMTADTEFGPVDLVAVERALAGERITLTRAEHRYIAALVRAHLAVRPVAHKAA